MLNFDFKEDNLFFFCGSGISYDSYLPSAAEILKLTSQIFLPTNIDKDELSVILNKIQPEIFYEHLLKLTNSVECLDLWKCLHNDYNSSLPNKEHIFIVYYSFMHNVPIFTTNFDLMFENAAKILGIEYDIFLPDDNPDDMDNRLNKLKICKLHGSISDKAGNLSINSLYSTMTQISKVNTRWIEYICKLMTLKNLCFVGYSGRDLDYFPFIANQVKLTKCCNIVWINNFESCDISNEKATNCKAIKVPFYPKDYFPYFSIYNECNFNVNNDICQTNIKYVNNLKKEELFLKLKEKLLLNEEEKILFYGILLQAIGKYRNAYIELTKIRYEINQKRLYLILIKHLSQLSHEIGKYHNCYLFSKILYKESDDVSDKIIALCLLCESFRMLVPNELYFKYEKNIVDKIFFYVFSIFVIIIFLVVWKYLDFMKNRSSISWTVSASHEYIEHKIRAISILIKIEGSSKGKLRLKNRILYLLNQLKDNSQKEGYAAGIANSDKFRRKLIHFDMINDNAESIYSMITSSTGTEILLRDNAEKKLKDKKYIEARCLVYQSIELAKYSGNTMNEIKAYLLLAYLNYQDKSYYLNKQDVEYFESLVKNIDGGLWGRYLSKLVKKFKLNLI